MGLRMFSARAHANITLVLVFIVATVAGYQHVYTSSAANPHFSLQWSLNGTHLMAEVRAATSGWVGIAVSPNGQMVGSDAIVGGWNNEVKEYALGAMSPSGITAYSTQVLTNTSLTYSNGEVSMTFTRPVSPGGELQNFDGVVNLLWAIGATKQKTKHSFATKVLNFNLSGTNPAPPTTPVYPPVLIAVACVIVAIVLLALRNSPAVNLVGTAVVVVFGAATGRIETKYPGDTEV